MPEGGPGDHPLNDIFNWGIEVYDKETDEIIKSLRQFLSGEELITWWNQCIGWDCDVTQVKIKAKEKLEWAIQRSKIKS